MKEAERADHSTLFCFFISHLFWLYHPFDTLGFPFFIHYFDKG